VWFGGYFIFRGRDTIWWLVSIRISYGICTDLFCIPHLAPCPGLEKMLEMIDEEEEEKQENKARWRVKWYPCITNHRGF
jgi:hypothetical protein